jgi:DNA-binding response OmpR family regulator
MRALVIEDEPLVAMLIEDQLTRMGYSVVVVDNEQAAVTAARRMRPDLITADAVLRDGSGVTAVRKICQAGVIPTIYILGWINAAGDGLMPHGFVMRKPFAAPTLYAAVNQAVFRADSLARSTA